MWKNKMWNIRFRKRCRVLRPKRSALRNMPRGTFHVETLSKSSVRCTWIFRNLRKGLESKNKDIVIRSRRFIVWHRNFSLLLSTAEQRLGFFVEGRDNVNVKLITSLDDSFLMCCKLYLLGEEVEDVVHKQFIGRFTDAMVEVGCSEFIALERLPPSGSLLFCAELCILQETYLHGREVVGNLDVPLSFDGCPQFVWAIHNFKAFLGHLDLDKKNIISHRLDINGRGLQILLRCDSSVRFHLRVYIDNDAPLLGFQFGIIKQDDLANSKYVGFDYANSCSEDFILLEEEELQNPEAGFLVDDTVLFRFMVTTSTSGQSREGEDGRKNLNEVESLRDENNTLKEKLKAKESVMKKWAEKYDEELKSLKSENKLLKDRDEKLIQEVRQMKEKLRTSEKILSSQKNDLLKRLDEEESARKRLKEESAKEIRSLKDQNKILKGKDLQLKQEAGKIQEDLIASERLQTQNNLLRGRIQDLEDGRRSVLEENRRLKEGSVQHEQDKLHMAKRIQQLEKDVGKVQEDVRELHLAKKIQQLENDIGRVQEDIQELKHNLELKR